MTTSYEEALQDTLEAVRRGEDAEAAIQRHPAHVPALREDTRLVEGVSKLALTTPRPSSEARMAASRRMMAQLGEERAKRAGKPGWLRGWASVRYAVAAALVVIAVLGAGLLLGGDGASVEAATIEGVVVENDGVMLTVQTLDALERVSVPLDTRVSDGAGASISLDRIEVGQVVVIDVQRRGRDVVAQRIERYRESIEAWCIDDSTQCQTLLAGLERAVRQCQLAPQSCRVTLERLEHLRQRAAESAPIEGLRRECRAADESACHKIEVFCRERPGTCSDRFLEFMPTRPPAEPTRPAVRPDAEAPAEQRVAPTTIPGRLPEVTPAVRTQTVPTTEPRSVPDATLTPPPARDASTPASRDAVSTPTLTSTPQPEQTPVRDVEPAEATPSRDAVTPSPEPARDLPTPTPTPDVPAVDSQDGLQAPSSR